METLSCNARLHSALDLVIKLQIRLPGWKERLPGKGKMLRDLEGKTFILFVMMSLKSINAENTRNDVIS